MIYLLRKREPTEKKQFLLPGQGEEEVYSHTNPPKVSFLLSVISQKKKRSKENLIKSKVLTTSHIRNWIRNGALEELEMVVLEGQVSL